LLNRFCCSERMAAATEISDDRMSFAQKEWPVRGRILMAGIRDANSELREKKALSGGVALVTGGSRGIGRAIAHRLASLGASISICGRDFATLEESAQSVAKIGVPLHFQTADVTKSADVTDLVVKTEMKLGQITI